MSVGTPESEADYHTDNLDPLEINFPISKYIQNNQVGEGAIECGFIKPRQIQKLPSSISSYSIEPVLEKIKALSTNMSEPSQVFSQDDDSQMDVEGTSITDDAIPLDPPESSDTPEYPVVEDDEDSIDPSTFPNITDDLIEESPQEALPDPSTAQPPMTPMTTGRLVVTSLSRCAPGGEKSTIQGSEDFLMALQKLRDGSDDKVEVPLYIGSNQFLKNGNDPQIPRIYHSRSMGLIESIKQDLNILPQLPTRYEELLGQMKIFQETQLNSVSTLIEEYKKMLQNYENQMALMATALSKSNKIIIAMEKQMGNLKIANQKAENTILRLENEARRAKLTNEPIPVNVTQPISSTSAEETAFKSTQEKTKWLKEFDLKDREGHVRNQAMRTWERMNLSLEEQRIMTPIMIRDILLEKEKFLDKYPEWNPIEEEFNRITGAEKFTTSMFKALIAAFKSYKKGSIKTSYIASEENPFPKASTSGIPEKRLKQELSGNTEKMLDFLLHGQT